MLYKKISISGLMCLALGGSCIAMQNPAAPATQNALEQADQAQQAAPFPRLFQICGAQRLLSNEELDAFRDNKENSYWQKIVRNFSIQDNTLSATVGQINMLRPGILYGLSHQNLPAAGSTSKAIFNRAGTRLATITENRVSVWRLQQNIWVHEQILQGHTATINSITFNATGNRIVTASDDATAIVWKLDRSSWIFEQALTGHTNRISETVFNEAGDRIATASDDNTAKVWALQNGHWALEATLAGAASGEDQTTKTPHFNQAGTRIIVATGNVCKIWLFTDGQWTLEQILQNQDTDVIMSVRFNETGTCIMGADGTNIIVWALQNNRWILEDNLNRLDGEEDGFIEQQEDTITELLATSGNRIVTDGPHGKPRIWIFQNNRWEIEVDLEENLNGFVRFASFNAAGNLLIATSDRRLRIWTFENNQWKTEQAITINQNTITSASFNATGSHIIITLDNAPPLIFNRKALLINSTDNLAQALLLVLAQREFQNGTPLNLDAHPHLMYMWNQLPKQTKKLLRQKYLVIAQNQETGQPAAKKQRTQ